MVDETDEPCEHVWKVALTHHHGESDLVRSERFVADEKFVQLVCQKCGVKEAARNELPITGPTRPAL